MIAARPILAVEADSAQRHILAENLCLGKEFTVNVAATLREADALLRRGRLV